MSTDERSCNFSAIASLPAQSHRPANVSPRTPIRGPVPRTETFETLLDPNRPAAGRGDIRWDREVS